MRRLLLRLVLLGLAGCSPTFNWRELRLEPAAAVAMFPCRPVHETRRVPLAGAPAAMTIWACGAGGASFALAHADLGDPTRVGPALQALRAAASANLSGHISAQAPAEVAGMTPHPEAARLRLGGRLPDGRSVEEQVLLFSKGTRVYQATVFGARLDAEAPDVFFAGLRLP